MDDLDHAVYVMERNGFYLDTDYLDAARKTAQGEEEVSLTELTKALHHLAPGHGEVNWASPLQLGALLHETLKLPPSPIWKKGRVRVDRGERKVDGEALVWIRDHSPTHIRPFLDELLTLRRLRSSVKYLAKLPTFVSPDGRVHPVSGPAMDSDDRAGTITWRLASKNPEVMQIPTDPKKDPFRIRRGFIAPPGYSLLVADEKALEVVILAHILITLFDDHQLSDMVAPGAPDIHSVNARRVFGEFLGWEAHNRPVKSYNYEDFKNEELPELVALRQDIKAIWYGLMYGKSAYGFATSLRDSRGNPIGEAAAQRIIDALYAALPGIPKYQAYVLEYIKRHHGIPGFGAWCDLSELTKSGDEWRVKRAHRIAQNYPMQEGGARVIGQAMVELTQSPGAREWGLLIERQIHDELDFRYPTSSPRNKVEAEVQKAMTSFPLRSCLQVSLGHGANWDEAKN